MIPSGLSKATSNALHCYVCFCAIIDHEPASVNRLDAKIRYLFSFSLKSINKRRGYNSSLSATIPSNFCITDILRTAGIADHERFSSEVPSWVSVYLVVPVFF